MPLIVIFFYLATVIAWRLGSEPGQTIGEYVGAAGSLITILLALSIGLRRSKRHWQWTGTLLFLTAVTAILYSCGLWPCEVACAGAGPYQGLYGIHVGILALVPLLITAITCFLANKNPEAAYGAAASWMLAGLSGASVYYLFLSWDIGLLCPYCLAVHTGTLSAFSSCLVHASGRWYARTGTIAVSALCLHAVYHPGAYLISPEHKPVDVELGLSTAQTRVLLSLDRARSRGHAEAPIKADLIIDLQCPHCREVVPQLLAGLAPAVQQGQLYLTWRYRYPRRIPGAKRLAELALAAAMAKKHDSFHAAMLGSPTFLEDPSDADKRLPADLSELAAFVDDPDLGAPLAILLQVDEARLDQMKIVGERTPVLVLRKSGKEIHRFTGIKVKPTLQQVQAYTRP